MKKTIFTKGLMILSVAACGLIMANCGGCNGEGSGSSGKLNKGGLLGNLPALYEKYAAEMASLEKKTEAESEKLIAGGEKNYGKIQKLFDEQQAKEKEKKEKFKADVKAELAKIAGKEVPVSFSEKLKSSDMLFYNLTEVKIVDDKGEAKVSFTITAKDDFTIPSMKAYDYTVYFRFMGGKAILEKSTTCIIPVSLTREAKSFKKGDVLNQSAIGFSLNRYAADRAAFSGIEFISKEEYNAEMGL